MNGYAPCTQVINSQDTADDISAHVIEHQNLPDWIAIFVQYRGGMRDSSAPGRLIEGCVIGRLWIMIKIQ